MLSLLLTLLTYSVAERKNFSEEGGHFDTWRPSSWDAKMLRSSMRKKNKKKVCTPAKSKITAIFLGCQSVPLINSNEKVEPR